MQEDKRNGEKVYVWDWQASKSRNQEELWEGRIYENQNLEIGWSKELAEKIKNAEANGSLTGRKYRQSSEQKQKVLPKSCY